MIRILLASLHLVALAIGFGAIVTRAAALRPRVLDAAAVRRALAADGGWGVAFGLWVITGLWRYLGDVEKATAYYNHNHLFLTKMGLVVVIIALELWPMVTLIKWRAALRRGAAAETVVLPAAARRIRAISLLQAVLLIVMVVLAVAMARGHGV